MKDTCMRAFDLEAAKRGEPVVTRDGRKVLEIYIFKTDVSHPIVAIIEGENIQTAYRLDGLYSNHENECDLFMVPKPPKKLWIAVAKELNSFGNHETSVAVHSRESLFDLDDYDNDGWNHIQIEVPCE